MLRAASGAVLHSEAARSANQDQVLRDAEAEFDKVFRELYPRVLAFALRRCSEREVAEDVANEAFLIAWRKWDQLPEEQFAWLAGTTRKLLANVRRGDSRRVPASWNGEEPLLNPSESVEEEVMRRRLLRDSFARLSERDKEVLRLIFWDGLTNREAAQVMGCSYSVFTLRLYRARRRFSEAIDEINS
jgi:RNA polymerase sigma-70 factor (ECF subfamily)